jgi:hypothetical protein
MLGYKPDKRIWGKVNAAILGENAASTLVTLMSGMCSLLVQEGICQDDAHARAHLAAMLISPDTGPVGSLRPFLDTELARLNDGKWVQ